MADAARLGEGALTVSVGIHAALCLVGSLDGDGGRPVAQGEAPGLARQLQAAAGPGEVLVSLVVRDKAQSRFEILDREPHAHGAPVRLKGRAVAVFLLGGSKADTVSGTGSAPAASSRLLGRSAEVGRLLSLMEASRREGGGGQAMLLTGGAGHGKSALVRHVLSAVREDDSAGASTLVLVAQCSATLGGVPMFTCRQWLQRWRGAQLSQGTALQRLLQTAGLEWQPGEPLLGALEALLGTSSEPVPVSEQTKALVAVLCGIAARRPLILAVEDAEHLEGSSQAALSALVDQLRELKLFVLVAVRTPKGAAGLCPEMSGWLRQDNGHHLEVGALSDAAGRELIAATATGGMLPAQCVDFIIAQCSGVALHLQQMVTAFVESSLLFLNDDRTYELEGQLETLKLPTTLHDSIRMRLANVRERDPDLERVLQLGACMAGTWTHESMARAWGALAPESTLLAAMQRGTQLGFIKYVDCRRFRIRIATCYHKTCFSKSRPLDIVPGLPYGSLSQVPHRHWQHGRRGDAPTALERGVRGQRQICIHAPADPGRRAGSPE